MSKKLQNLYRHLINNRKHHLIGWYKSYKDITGAVQKVKTALENSENSIDLNSKELYAETYYSKSDNPYDVFIKDLVYEKSNGVSSRGQSVLSKENFNSFKEDSLFRETIKEIILQPDFTGFEKLKKYWSDREVGNNPVLINRIMGAATLDVTTTVDNGKFDQVFKWLQDRNLIPTYNATETDWFHKNKYAISEIREGLKDLWNDDEVEIDDHWIGLFYWEIYTNLSNPFSLKKQVVKYGAPGTGKTYNAKKTTELQYELWCGEIEAGSDITYDELVKVVQFHPSFTYEDFMEGLRPTIDNQNQTQLALQNGVFKDLCIKAGKWEKDLIEQKIINKNRKWEDLKVEDIHSYKDKLNGVHWEFIFNADPGKKLESIVPPFFIIIDEINRAELSRVFGELMYCLEYRGYEGMIKTQYSHLNTDSTGMIKIGEEYRFFVPNNVFIIATMNTIDRSVESFDFALRRRFRWEEVQPDTSILRYHLTENTDKPHFKNWSDLAKNLENLNDNIRNQELLGKDYCIGHAYLWNLNYAENSSVSEVRKAVWEDNIQPLLQEYLRGTGREAELLGKFKKSFSLN
ncbi:MULTISPECIES: McrB family protein [Flavobacteriaceae]|uniref:AAA family ATPase n=1 Tax=Autumnicola edwardsiae TaxID=3075594 RepID=A0ABU3CYI7_9FLAO|nr:MULTISPECIES: AAA family ATPase [Flavobacteriaceae]MDT0651326.1 AAA family ATPase [Zunongwangia sp. F297]|tara:strand:+ start:6222 stop:7943 length:1722 start_codon:yes stop_codon:yes gene_type:complete